MTTEQEMELADRVRFVLSDEQWKKFIELLECPASNNAALRKLLTEPSVLDDP